MHARFKPEPSPLHTAQIESIMLHPSFFWLMSPPPVSHVIIADEKAKWGI